MSDFQRNDGRESWEIHTTTMGNTIKTIVFDMPPSYESITYDIAIKNEKSSYQKLLNPTKTEYQTIFYSKDYEIDRLEKENQRLNKIISKKDKLLESNSAKIRNYKMSILVSITLLFIVPVIIVTFLFDFITTCATERIALFYPKSL